MANLLSQELDRTERRELTVKLWIRRVRAVRKNQPKAVVPRGFGMIAEHANYTVAQIDAKTRKNATHLGVQGCERFHDECMRGFLFWFGGTRHGLYGLSESVITRLAPILDR